MIDKIEKLKKYHQNELDNYNSETFDFIKEYGNISCDYLAHRRSMTVYYRGAVNALIELEKML